MRCCCPRMLRPAAGRRRRLTEERPIARVALAESQHAHAPRADDARASGGRSPPQAQRAPAAGPLPEGAPPGTGPAPCVRMPLASRTRHHCGQRAVARRASGAREAGHRQAGLRASRAAAKTRLSPTLANIHNILSSQKPSRSRRTHAAPASQRAPAYLATSRSRRARQCTPGAAACIGAPRACRAWACRWRRGCASGARASRRAAPATSSTRSTRTTCATTTRARASAPTTRPTPASRSSPRPCPRRSARPRAAVRAAPALRSCGAAMHRDDLNKGSLTSRRSAPALTCCCCLW